MRKHLSDYSLKGNVGFFIEKTKELPDPARKPMIKKTFSFDQNGYLIKRTIEYYGTDYSGLITVLYEYSKDDRVVRKTEILTDDNFGFKEGYNKKVTLFKNGKISKITLQMDDKILSERLYKYFSEGSKKEIIERYIYYYKNPPLYDDHFYIPLSLKESLKKIQEGTIEERTVYDINGNIVLETKNGDLGEFRSKQEFTYDNKGNLIKKLIFKNKTEISKKILFSYDILKKYVEKNEYDENDILLVNEVSRYNEKGNEIEKIEYFYKGSEMSIQITTSSYDQEDQLTEMVFISQDRNGNMKEERHRLPRSSDLSTPEKTDSEKITQYDYDIYGNWITKKIISLNSDRQTIYTRKIQYKE